MEVTISKSNYTFADVPTWLDSVGRTCENADLAMWHFVLTLAAGVDQFGKNDKAKIEELYDLASQQTGVRVTSLKTYVSAAHSPKAVMALEHGLTFQHARAVLGLDDDVADDMLARAKAGGWLPEKLGHEAWAKRNGLPSPSQRTLTGNTPPPPANEIAHSTKPGRTMSPPSAYATRNGYRATDDIDDRAEYLEAAPDAYDDTDDVPFSHHRADCATCADLWPDERIDAMVDAVACEVEYTDADGLTHTRRYVLAEDVQRLLRTVRDEFEAIR